MFLCLDCNHVFGGYGDSGCLNCKNTNHFPVDELLIPAILLLNEMGYETKACCSGHLYYGEGYIWFKQEYMLPEPEPPLVLDGEFIRWTSHNEGQDYFRNQSEIITQINALNKYVQDLGKVHIGCKHIRGSDHHDAIRAGLHNCSVS